MEIKKKDLSGILSEYKKSGAARFHMPGSKGRLGGSDPAFDVTELPFTDDLLRPRKNGPVDELEDGLKRAFFGGRGEISSRISTGGATLLIQAAVLALRRKTGGKYLICGREAHISLINALALTGTEPLWIYPGEDFCGGIKFYSANFTGIAGVFVTSPDYYGEIRAGREIYDEARRHNLPVVTDNSHGSHLAFHKDGGMHPINLGSRLSVDSLHKTLPAPTGTAILHYDNRLFTREEINSALRAFASSSPSFLLLEKLCGLRSFLEGEARESHARLLERIAPFAPQAENRDPFRMVIESGDGRGLYDFFTSRNIICEFFDGKRVILIPSVNNTASDFKALAEAVEEYKKIHGEGSLSFGYSPGENDTPRPLERALPLSDALVKRRSPIPAGLCEGKISAEAHYFYPPGIPFVLPGERIDGAAAKKIAELTDEVYIINETEEKS